MTVYNLLKTERDSMKKIILVTIICCFFLSACGTNTENTSSAGETKFTPFTIDDNNSSVITAEKETTYNTTTESQTIPAKKEENTAVSEASGESEIIINTTTEPQISEAPTESSLQTESPSTKATTAEVDMPQWTETEVNGELYVNTNNIYSRISAIQGSKKAVQYKLNDKVTVIAKTDTDYYKLSDGTFIHADYLSENETAEVTENESGDDYIAVSKTGYTIERKNDITYVDGIMIANKTYSLPKSYDPGITNEAASALKEMQNAAAAEGLSLYVVSGYRSYKTQESVYAGWVNRDGKEQADTYSSRPGHSDHQTGYSYDLNSLEQSFADTKEGKWLAEHCAEFGFIIRYPEGKEMYTGYIYEPWHVRYIGKEKAKIITESGLSLEEYYGITSAYSDYTGA